MEAIENEVAATVDGVNEVAATVDRVNDEMSKLVKGINVLSAKCSLYEQIIGALANRYSNEQGEIRLNITDVTNHLKNDETLAMFMMEIDSEGNAIITCLGDKVRSH